MRGNLVCSRRNCLPCEPSCFQGIIILPRIGLFCHPPREFVGVVYLMRNSHSTGWVTPDPEGIEYDTMLHAVCEAGSI